MLHHKGETKSFPLISLDCEKKDDSVKDSENKQNSEMRQDNIAIIMCIISYCLQFSSYVYLET